jgi:hypothetical protein
MLYFNYSRGTESKYTFFFFDSSGWMSQRVDVSVGGNLDGWMSRWVDVSVGRCLSG